MMKIYLRAFAYTILITMISISVAYSQDETGSFVFEGRARNYLVYLPQNFQSNMPVVLNLHGWSWTTGGHANYTLMHEVADTSGFIVVYPEGSTADGYAGWNNGYRNEPSSPTDTTSNDVGFISALIDTLHAHYAIDLSRVYSCGFSMGGIMTYRLAIELGHRFAAIASVAGKLNDVSGNLGDPLRPYPPYSIFTEQQTIGSCMDQDTVILGPLWRL
jgi:polyhydroxybutyrate depolymerase